MSALHTRRAHLGAQNDAMFIIHGEAPASSNDYPRHDADRVAIARVFDDEGCRRLVVCWNACEGIETELLEEIPSIVGSTVPYRELRQQHAELLAALQNYVATIATAGGGDKVLFMAALRGADDKARALIAKATGGTA